MGSFGGFYKGDKKKPKKEKLEEKARNLSFQKPFVLPKVEIIRKEIIEVLLLKLPRWKKEQKEKKSRQIKSRLRFFLGAVIFLGIMVAAFSFLRIYWTSVLPKNGRITVVYNISPLKVLTFDQEGKVIFLQLPDHLSAGSIQEFLGAPIDAVATDLNLWDRFKIWRKIKSVKTNMVKTIDLRKIVPAKVDLELAGVFRDSQIGREALTIEVLNGSNKPEMANRAARLITNLGGRIIGLGNSEKEIETCRLKGDGEALKSLTGQRLKKIFNCEEILLKTPQSRADLQLTVGLDYWQKLNEK